MRSKQLQVLGEVGRAVSSTLDLETVLTTIVARADQLSGTDGGVIYEYDEATERFHLRATQKLEEQLVESLRATPHADGRRARSGRAAAAREPVQIPDIREEARVPEPLRDRRASGPDSARSSPSRSSARIGSSAASS